jgi:hypothetical protein
MMIRLSKRECETVCLALGCWYDIIEEEDVPKKELARPEIAKLMARIDPDAPPYPLPEEYKYV